MAGKALDVRGYDHDTGMVSVYNGVRAWDSHYRYQTRNTLVVLAGKLGYKLTKSPLKYTTNELVAVVADRTHHGKGKVVFTRPTVPVPVPPPSPSATATEPSPSVVNNAFTAMIRTIMDEMGQSSMDKEAVAEIVNETIKEPISSVTESVLKFHELMTTKVADLRQQIINSQPTVVQVTLSGGQTHKIEGRVHSMFDKVLRVVDAGLSPWLTGGAGVGKTTIAEQVAKALGLEFSPESFCSQSSEVKMKGYNTANGLYVSTEFRKRFEEGGVYLLDEVDAANPNILLALNSALSNGIVSFPDKVVRKHPKFIAIACANTYGNGATAEYVGRQVIDGASLDRFVKLDIPIDTNMEAGIVSDLSVDKDAGTQWLVMLNLARRNVERYGLKVIVSPRSAYSGAKLLNAGFSFSECVQMTFGSGLKKDQYDKVMDNISVPDGGAKISA